MKTTTHTNESATAARPAAEAFFAPSIQAKLTVNQPGDIYEQEADSVADKVVQRISETPVHRKCSDCEQEDKLQKDEEPLIQEKIQSKPIFDSNSEPPPDELGGPNRLQRRETANDPAAAPDGFNTLLQSSKGSGSQLPESTRTQMGSAFGADFSNVQIHTGDDAIQMSRSIQAQAFTHGNDVYFNTGRYDTESTEGKKLLAHELTHTIQQDNGISVVNNLKNSVQRSNIEIDRSKAFVALTKWQNAQNVFLTDVRTYLELNFNDYFKYTSSNPSLAWSPSIWKEVLNGTLENASSELLFGRGLQLTSKYLVKKAYKNLILKALTTGLTAAALAFETTPLGMAVAFVAGVIVELVVSALLDDSDKIFAQGSLAAGNLIGEKIVEFGNQQKIALASIEDIGQSMSDWITDSSNQLEVDYLTDLLKMEAKNISSHHPDTSNRALFEKMIKDWVLEHAGDEEDPDFETSEDQWNTALKLIKERGLIPNGPDLDNHPEIFAYQFRAELGRLGLKTDQAEKILDKVRKIQYDNPLNPSEAIRAYFDDDENMANGYTFNYEDVVSYDKLINRVNETYDGMDLSDKAKERIKEGNFMLYVFLDLTEGDGSVYVDDFYYRMVLFGDLEFLTFRKFTWGESPD